MPVVQWRHSRPPHRIAREISGARKRIFRRNARGATKWFHVAVNCGEASLCCAPIGTRSAGARYPVIVAPRRPRGYRCAASSGGCRGGRSPLAWADVPRRAHIVLSPRVSPEWGRPGASGMEFSGGDSAVASRHFGPVRAALASSEIVQGLPFEPCCRPCSAPFRCSSRNVSDPELWPPRPSCIRCSSSGPTGRRRARRASARTPRAGQSWAGRAPRGRTAPCSRVRPPAGRAGA